MSEMVYLSNIKAFVPRNYQNQPHSIYHKLPITRRSAVFILLFIGKLGELRVILTKRSSKLKNFPGHISLPGGKAENGLETEWTTSRREMEEEIGISSNNEVLLREHGFKIDHLGMLPCYLSRTFLAVRPCVGFINWNDGITAGRIATSLNPGESSSIFSVPLKDFLYPLGNDKLDSIKKTCVKTKWGGIDWNMRSYIFPKENDNEIDWLKEVGDLSEDDTEVMNIHGRTGSRRDENSGLHIYDVWGLTANILHDLAEVVYSPNATSRELGEEELLHALYEYGNQLQGKERTEYELRMMKGDKRSSFGELIPDEKYSSLKQIYSRL